MLDLLEAAVGDVSDDDDATAGCERTAMGLVPASLVVIDLTAEAHRELLAPRGPRTWPVRVANGRPVGILEVGLVGVAEVPLVGPVGQRDVAIGSDDDDRLSDGGEDDLEACALLLADLALLLERVGKVLELGRTGRRVFVRRVQSSTVAATLR